jgi:undecaprenyl-diphosphatase
MSVVGAHESTPLRISRARMATLGISFAVAVVCGIVASGGTVPQWEADIFHAINDLPDWLRPAMWTFQLAGLLFTPLVVAAVAFAFGRRRLALALVVLVPLKLLAEKGVVKHLVERQRPGTTICHLDESCAHFRGVPLEGLSFVSGHAVIAWGIAGLLWTALPRPWRWVPVAIAALNAIARVYLGAHNPLDVVGGAAIGIFLAALIGVFIRPDAR